MYISKAKLILSFSPSSWMGEHLIKEKPAETTTASLYSLLLPPIHCSKWRKVEQVRNDRVAAKVRRPLESLVSTTLSPPSSSNSFRSVASTPLKNIFQHGIPYSRRLSKNIYILFQKFIFHSKCSSSFLVDLWIISGKSSSVLKVNENSSKLV